MVFERLSLYEAYSIVKHDNPRVDDFMESLINGYIKLCFKTSAERIADDEEIEVWGGKEGETMSYERLQSVFQSRELKLPLDSLREAWEVNRDSVFKYFELSQRGETVLARTSLHLYISPEHLHQFENRKVWIGDIYADKEDLLASTFYIYEKLKSMVHPLDESFRKVRIIYDGKEYVDEYSEGQADLLKRLYEGTLKNPKFSIPTHEYGQNIGKQNPSYRSAFKNKYISNLKLLKNEAGAIRFNLK